MRRIQGGIFVYVPMSILFCFWTVRSKLLSTVRSARIHSKALKKNFGDARRRGRFQREVESGVALHSRRVMVKKHADKVMP